jgi:hypothetical protein
VPDWMLSIKQMNTKEKRQLRGFAPRRREIKTDIESNVHRPKGDKKKKKKKTV